MNLLFVITIQENSVSTAVVKDWILHYAEASDSDSDAIEDDKCARDPNETYLELVARLEDLKLEAAQIKRQGKHADSKSVTQQIASLVKRKTAGIDGI